MTMPANSPLLPNLQGRTLSMDAALRSPTIIAQQIAKLSDEIVLLPRLFRQYGSKTQGGALLWNSISSSDYYLAGPLEPTSPARNTPSLKQSYPTRG
jgi:hypothetical protein